MTITPEQLRFLSAQRVGRLATADAGGVPHVVPVCYAVDEASVYIGLDAKPKQVEPTQLKRVRNIIENPRVSMIVDRYDEDWTRLGWVRLDGRAEVLLIGPERQTAIRLLRDRYEQYERLLPDDAPVIVVRVEQASSWGNLA